LVIAIIILSFLLTLILTQYYIQFASKRNILDFPSDRGSHAEPKPRGGGVVFVLVMTISFASIHFHDQLHSKLSDVILWPMLMGGLVIAYVGFLDDCKGLSQIARLLVHLTTFAVVFSFYPLPLSANPYLYWPLFILAVIASGWMLNLYNFMDGIDGIAASEGVFVFLSAALLIYISSDDTKIITVLLCAAAALLGFLWLNWPPSKLFMGDVGSGFIGYLMALLIGITWKYGLMQPPVWAILLGFFIFDATATLFKRVIKGEQFYKAHKEHLYQRLARRWNSHKTITLFVILIDTVWLLPMAWLAIKYPEISFVILILAYFPIAIIYYYIEMTDNKSHKSISS
jgi:Fuc2NAc and GlcNAc transferase